MITPDMRRRLREYGETDEEIDGYETRRGPRIVGILRELQSSRLIIPFLHCSIISRCLSVPLCFAEFRKLPRHRTMINVRAVLLKLLSQTPKSLVVTMLRVYFDDSGTHKDGRSKMVICGGVIISG